MKVNFESDAKNLYTGYEYEAAKAVIEYAKKEESKTAAEEYLYRAACVVLKDSMDSPERVLEVKCTTIRDNKVFERICDGSRNITIWIDGYVKTAFGIIAVATTIDTAWEFNADSTAEGIWFRYYGDKAIPTK